MSIKETEIFGRGNNCIEDISNEDMDLSRRQLEMHRPQRYINGHIFESITNCRGKFK